MQAVAALPVLVSGVVAPDGWPCVSAAIEEAVARAAARNRVCRRMRAPCFLVCRRAGSGASGVSREAAGRINLV